MRHFKQLLLVILTLSLLLCGCGGTQANGTDETNDNSNNTTDTNENNNSIVEKDEYSLSEYNSTGETIWFLTDGYGKDDEIEQIFVFDPNGNMYYCDCDWKLGEAEQKEDSEINSYVKQEYEKNMTEQVNKAIAWQGTTALSDLSIVVSDTATLFSPYINIEPAQYKFSIISDSTGNNTEWEVLAYQEYAPIFFNEDSGCVATITYIRLAYIPQYESDKGATNCFQIYDSWYGGYGVKCITNSANDLDRNEKTTKYLLTRLNASKHFTLDEVGTANIGIDNADSLFEAIKVDIDFESVEMDYDY